MRQARNVPPPYFVLEIRKMIVVIVDTIEITVCNALVSIIDSLLVCILRFPYQFPPRGCGIQIVDRWNAVVRQNQGIGPAATWERLILLTLLQLPLIEVGNAVRADCYSIASYP